jgi:hypothetical protein
VLGAALIVIVIACQSEACGAEPLEHAFEQAARRVLGRDAQLQVEQAIDDPPDEQSAARAAGVDGVVELSFDPQRNSARLHCYLSREQRWLDREINFGASRPGSRRESIERGRLLGFAAASIFDAKLEQDPQREAAPVPDEPPAAVLPTGTPAPPPAQLLTRTRSSAPPSPRARRSVEFAGVVSAGIGGTAAGLGASAGLRSGWAGPLWLRLFLGGRAGNIPEAQASTRTALLGGGLALALLPETHRFELGARLDLFGGYFDVTHLSEDDIAPDRRHRWLAGADLVAEAGFRFVGEAGLLLGVGIEAVAGKTEVYTHHNRVAVVPPLRAVMEFGFRTNF